MSQLPATHPRTLEEQMRERFDQEAAGHRMRVLRDDGLYRHLRFSNPDNGFYWYDLITWPGSLCIHGDCGTYVFSRIEDMFRFFESSTGRINPHYWAEKLQAFEKPVEVYSRDLYFERVKQWRDEVCEDLTPEEAEGLRRAVDEQLLEDSWDELASEDVAHLRLRDFSYKQDGHTYEIVDSWEWDMRQYTWGYLWCLWAIVRGIATYRQQEQATATASSDSADSQASASAPDVTETAGAGEGAGTDAAEATVEEAGPDA